jgi:hypothetical protein
MLNTSVTHITELEDAIGEALGILQGCADIYAAKKGLLTMKHPSGERLKHAAESFGLDLSDLLKFHPGISAYDEDDPFGTGDI